MKCSKCEDNGFVRGRTPAHVGFCDCAAAEQYKGSILTAQETRILNELIGLCRNVQKRISPDGSIPNDNADWNDCGRIIWNIERLMFPANRG